MKIQDLAILLVEPSSTQRKIIVNQLMQAVVKRVDVAVNQTEAMRFLQEGPGVPDLIISSMYLPDGDGLQFIYACQEDPILVEIPFMLVTCDQNRDLLVKFRNAGVAGILPKPFQKEDIEDALACVAVLESDEELELEYFDVANLKVLVVDDSIMSRGYLKRFLFNLGFVHLYEAEDGVEALEKLEQDTFDILFSDYKMPKLNGLELAKKIQDNARHAMMPVVMVTSFLNDIGSEWQEAGVREIFGKPFDARQFRDKLKKILEC